MELKQLLSLPESRTLEFKRDISSLDSILKGIVAFANTAGGTLIIGRSSEGIVIGVEDIFKAEETIANSIADGICPSFLPEIEIATIDGKDLLIIKVSHWKGPFYLKKEGIPKGVYVRLGSTSRPASPELLTELQRSVPSLSFDQQPVMYLSKSDLNLSLVSQVFRAAGKKITEEKLLSMGVLVAIANQRVPSIGGVILFGQKSIRERFVPDARVSLACFQGDSKTTILDHKEVNGTIVDALTEILAFIARNTRLAAEIQDIRRKDIPEYPKIAVREALINALAHADYSITGSRIQVAVFSNRLEIQNPGMLPFGFTMEDLKSGVSRARNRVIVRVFHAVALMEEWGSGYKRIIEACEDGGYPEPKWEELGAVIRVTFYSHLQARPLEEKTATKSSIEPVDREKFIINLFIKGESLPFREIFSRITPPISERMLRYHLASLRKKGLLVPKGKGSATVWQKVF